MLCGFSRQVPPADTVALACTVSLYLPLSPSPLLGVSRADALSELAEVDDATHLWSYERLTTTTTVLPYLYTLDLYLSTRNPPPSDDLKSAMYDAVAAAPSPHDVDLDSYDLRVLLFPEINVFWGGLGLKPGSMVWLHDTTSRTRKPRRVVLAVALSLLRSLTRCP